MSDRVTQAIHTPEPVRCCTAAGTRPQSSAAPGGMSALQAQRPIVVWSSLQVYDNKLVQQPQQVLLKLVLSHQQHLAAHRSAGMEQVHAHEACS
jgi:hypothetical protein